MPREKFTTLTEQMFYLLLCLRTQCYGTDLMERVKRLTGGRVEVGAGTVYNLLEQFLAAGMIKETAREGRRRCYMLTELGQDRLNKEYDRLKILVGDFEEYRRQSDVRL